MFESSIRLGRIAGVRIGVHYTWFIIFALLFFALTAYFRTIRPEWTQAEAMFGAVAAALVFFFSIILHELGHSLVAISRGIPVHSITLFIFGGVAQSEEEAADAKTEFMVAIAGPLVSFALAAFFYLLSVPAAGFSDMLATGLSWLAVINFVVAVFNLVPGFPLDGGRVFRAIVWWATGDAMKGMRWAVRGGKFVAFGLMFLGVLVFLQTGYLINALWLVAIGWFLMSAAEASGTQYLLRQTMQGVPVKRFMNRDVPRVPGSLTLVDWMDSHVLPTGQRAYLVTDNDRTVGLATLSDAKKVERDDWGRTAVHQVMTPLDRLRTATPETEVIDVLGAMDRDSLNQVPVVEDGQVAGWIDRNRLISVIQAHMESGR